MDLAFIGLGRPPLQTTIDGVNLWGYLRHRGFLASLLDGEYESLSRRLYQQSLRPGLTVVDGGAHIGLYTLLAARGLGRDGRIVALEPDPYNFRALRLNVQRAGHQNVTVLRKALSNTMGIASFHRNVGTIGCSLIDRTTVRPSQRIAVEVTTLDAILGNEVPGALLIKLDIEGAEPLALRGMRQVLKRAESVVLLLELNPPALRDAGADPRALVAELERLGFGVRIVDEQRGQLLPMTKEGAARKANLYCVRGAQRGRQ